RRRRTGTGAALSAGRWVAAVVVAVAGCLADPLLRRVAAAVPSRRGPWLASPVDPPRVLGVATGVMAGALVVTADPAALALTGAGLAPVVVLSSAVDLRWHRLPDRLTVPAALGLAVLVVVAAVAATDAAIAVGAVAGAALLAGLLL